MRIPAKRKADIRKQLRLLRKQIRRVERFYKGETFFVTPHAWHIKTMLQELAMIERLVAQDTAETHVSQEEIPF
jgi:Uri superfamily endonuclease